MAGALAATVRYPVAGDRRERPLLGLWLLLAVGFVVPVVVLVPVVGYLLRVLDASERDETVPALFASPHWLLWHGLVATALSAIVLAVPIGTLLVLIYGAMFEISPTAIGEFSTPSVYAASTAILALALLGGYLLPIVLFRYIRTGRAREAFDRRWLRGAATHGAYFAGWTLGGTIAVIGLGLARAVLPVSRLGPVVAALVLAYTAIVTCHVWGRSLARVQ